MINNSLLLFLCCFFLASCSTPQYRLAKTECSPNAYAKYPVNNVTTLVTKQRSIQVPTGQTNCTTSYVGSFANTTCTQVMRTQLIPYQESVTIDVNESARDSEIKVCAQNLCYQRYGNPECKADQKAESKTN